VTFQVLKQIRKGSLVKDRVTQKLENTSVSKAKPGQPISFPQKEKQASWKASKGNKLW